MEREIKFRVWTGVQMEYNVMAGFLGVFYVQEMDKMDTASMTSFNTKYSDSMPVMQFTGIKDWSGKEIYEGDIYLPNKREIRVIVWEPESAQFASVELDGDGEILCGSCEALNQFGFDSVKIIGNIYENPDLKLKP